MAGLNFDVSGARQAGYSDAEIVSHLADTKSGFDVPGALKAGYSPTEILSHLAPEPSGLVDNMRQGASEALSGVGSTLKNYVGPGYGGDTLEAAGKSIAPANFVSSPIVDKDGFHASGILPTLARAAPAAAGAVIAAGMAPEALGTAGAIGVGAGANWMMSAGDAAKQAAATRTGDPNATPNSSDKLRGGLTAAASSAVQSLPITHFIPGSGVITDTGLKGVGGAVKKLGVTAADQSAASAAANATSQVGQTVGTDGGVSVDPTQVLNAGATGGVVGGALGAKGAVRTSLDATKFSGITDDLRPAATQFANRMVNAADGDKASLQGSLFSSGSAQRAGEDTFTKAKAAVHNELGAAVGDLNSRVTLSTDSTNILKSALGGTMPSPGDYAKLKSEIAADPQGPNVINLIQQAHAADIFGDTGYHGNGKFTGGLSGAFKHVLTGENVLKSGIAGIGGAALEGGAGHIIAYSPEVLAAAAGGSVLGRYLDNITGAQAPAGRIVRNFADGQTPVRLPVAPQPAPTGPAPNNAPQAPMVGPPRPWSSPQAMAAILAAKRAGPAPVAPAPTPGGAPLAGGPGTSPMIPPAVAAQMSARANIAKLIAAKQSAQQTQTVQQALPLLRTLAERQGPNAKALELPADFTKTLTNPGASAPAPAPAAPPEPALNPLALPSSITGPAKAIMRGANIAQKLKTDAIGQDAAKAEVNASPFIDQKVGGAANIPSPAAAKYMSAAVRGAGVLAKLKSDPEAEAEDKAQAKADAAAEKQKVKDAAKAAAPPSVTISKANGQTKVGDEPFAPSSYAQYPPDVAARAITKAAGDTVKFPANHTASVKTRIQGERNIMARIDAEVPGLPIADLTARLEGRTDQTDAKAYREHLKTLFPQAAPVIDKHLSDGAIESLWSRKNAPKKK